MELKYGELKYGAEHSLFVQPATVKSGGSYLQQLSIPHICNRSIGVVYSQVVIGLFQCPWHHGCTAATREATRGGTLGIAEITKKLAKALSANNLRI